MAKPHLIVVDDEPDLSELIAFVAEGVGFDVDTADSAKALIDLCDDIEPAVIVMDIVMPDMDGYELMKWLSERGSKAKVILVSGYQGKYLEVGEALGSSYGINVVAKLEKPVAMTTLRQTLARFLPCSG